MARSGSLSFVLLVKQSPKSALRSSAYQDVGEMTVASKTKGHKHDYCKPGDHVYIAMNTSTGHSMLQNDEYYHKHPSVNNAGKEFTHTLELKKVPHIKIKA